jgi:probable phosphoglycerate mutase
VRHAQTAWNAQGRWQGQAGEGLDEIGRAQAATTAHHLAAAHPDARRIARSDSQRAAETSAYVEALLDVPVDVDVRLREMDVGTWSGRTREQVEHFDPAGWAAYRRGDGGPLGGGEAVTQLADRMVAALRDLAVRTGPGTAIVITHGWALRVGVAALLELGPSEAEELGRAPNCSISVLELDGDTTTLVDYAGCAHLEADAPLAIHRGR